MLPSTAKIRYLLAFLTIASSGALSAQSPFRFHLSGGIETLGDTWPSAPHGSYAEIGASKWLGRPAFLRVSIGLSATWLRRTATLADTSKSVVAIGGKGSIELHEGRERWEFFQTLGAGLNAFSVSRTLPTGSAIRDVHQSIDGIDLAVGVRIRVGRLWIGIESTAVHYGDPFDTRAGAHVIALDLTF